MTELIALCKVCGEPMPENEEMFKFHGYSGPCPKPPLSKTVESTASLREKVEKEINGGYQQSLTNIANLILEERQAAKANIAKEMKDDASKAYLEGYKAGRVELGERIKQLAWDIDRQSPMWSENSRKVLLALDSLADNLINGEA